MSALRQVAAPKKKAKEVKDKVEQVLPKTVAEKAELKMQDMLGMASTARTQSIKLADTQYADELSKKLLDLAQQLEEKYRDLKEAVAKKVADLVLEKLLQEVEQLEAFGEKAKAIH